MYTHKTGFLPPVSCAWAENRIEQYKSKAIEQTRQALAGFEIAVDSAKKRLAQLSVLESNDPYRKRMKLDSTVGVIPPPVRVTTEAKRPGAGKLRRPKKLRMLPWLPVRSKMFKKLRLLCRSLLLQLSMLLLMMWSRMMSALEVRLLLLMLSKIVIGSDNMSDDDMEQVDTGHCSPVRPSSPALSIAAVSPTRPICLPLPCAFWPDRRFQGQAQVPRVVVEVDLRENEVLLCCPGW